MTPKSWKRCLRGLLDEKEVDYPQRATAVMDGVVSVGPLKRDHLRVAQEILEKLKPKQSPGGVGLFATTFQMGPNRTCGTRTPCGRCWNDAQARGAHRGTRPRAGVFPLGRPGDQTKAIGCGARRKKNCCSRRSRSENPASTNCMRQTSSIRSAQHAPGARAPTGNFSIGLMRSARAPGPVVRLAGL